LLSSSFPGPSRLGTTAKPVSLGDAQQRWLLAIVLSASGQMLSLDCLEATLWPHGDALTFCEPSSIAAAAPALV
jgi:hypothetical protein